MNVYNAILKRRSIRKFKSDFLSEEIIENILLAATNFGLGTVWCGLYPVLERANAVREIINEEKNIIPLGVIHIGYPDEEKEERSQYNIKYVHYMK